MTKKNDNRDSIDFGRMNVPRLFIHLFIPTLLGLISNALLNLADGVFVGRGVGSDALAAINVAAPIFLICTGLSLMFGSGVSVVAAIHLSRGNTKAANINVTQAFTCALLMMVVISAVVMTFPEQTGRLFGGSDRLLPLVKDYIMGVTPGLPALLVMIIGFFVIRLDGAPRVAMALQVVSSLTNIVLDWIFVFPLHWGISGAAWATSVAEWLGALMVMGYLLCFSKTIKFYKPKFTATALALTARNVGYMMKLGLSTLIAELGISVMMIVGNYMFIARLHEEGVAAFSIVCYLFPLIFMFGNAIAQSALPIISYNHGAGQHDRVRRTLKLSLQGGLLCGILISICVALGAPLLVSLFLSSTEKAWQLAVDGLPLFATGITFFTLNIVLIGYEQSIEQARPAIIHMLLRGVLVLVPSFILLPAAIDNSGLWLAVPLSETITLAAIAWHMHTHWMKPSANSCNSMTKEKTTNIDFKDETS